MPRARKAPPVVEPFGGRPQPSKTPTGLPYGEHQALAGAQAAIPLPGGGAPNPAEAPPPGAGAPPAPAPPGAGGPPPPPPGNPVEAAAAMAPPTPLTAPTARPDEPVMAGAGANPIAAPTGPDPRLYLQSLYQVWPNADVADLLAHLNG